MSRKIVDKRDGLPTIEEIAADFDAKHSSTDKPAGQPKEPNDVSLTIEDDNREPPNLGGTMTTEADPSRIEGGESDVPEKPTQEPPKDEKKDFLSSRFSALSRREKAARELEAEVSRQRAELDQRMKEIEERQQKVAAAKSPLDLLKAHGFSYQDVTEHYLGVAKEPEKDPIDAKLEERFAPLSEKLKSLEETNARLQSIIDQHEQERIQSHAQQFRNNIAETAKAENHELILAAGDEAIDLVQNVISQYYQKYKKVLSFSEACATVESYYTDRVSKLSEVEKIRSRFAPPSPVPAAKPQKEVKSPNTLTQSLAQGTRATRSIDELPKQEALDELVKRLRYI